MTWISVTSLQDGNRVLLSTSPEFPRPRLHFEIGRRGELIAHRISLNGETLALIRLDDWWDWLWVGFNEFPALFGHLRAAAVDIAHDNPAAFVRNEMLQKPELLGRGDFVVEPLRLYSDRKDARRAIFVESNASTNDPWAQFETCGVIPLRKSSSSDSGRVKWYRKLAREGRLPPVFLYHHVGLISWLIIDGHDRLLAARLEDIAPTFVGISSVRRTEIPIPDETRLQLEEVLAQTLKNRPYPRTVDGVNKRLISMYQEADWRACTRGVRLKGGIDYWVSECRRLALPREEFEATS